MDNLFIIYAADSPGGRKAADEVRAAFEEAHYKPVVKNAAGSSISDIAAADIILFGLQKTDSSELPAEFGELARIFKGVNLAGKTAGFFSIGGEKASAKLRKILRDSDISQLEDEPVFSDKSPELHGWVKTVAAFHKEARGGR